MNEIVYFFVLLFLGIWEVWLAYALVEEIFSLKNLKTKKYTITKWGNIFVLGTLVAINRLIAFSSRTLVILCILVTFICVSRFTKGKRCLAFGVVAFYYVFLTILDFLFSFLCIEVVGTEFERIIYVEEYSGWAIGIYSLARVVMWIVLCKSVRDFLKEWQLVLIAYKKIFFFTCALLFVIMCRYQFVLATMAMGEREIQGVDKALLLLAILVIILMGGFLYFQYILKIREVGFLKYQEQMLRDRCREMQQTRQIAHDMRNHVIALKKYDEEGKAEKLHEYIQSLSRDVTLYETQVWTGIEILDYLLTQEKKKADQRNIKFQIETQRIDSLPFSDIEIVSIFGNLLDNAIEACEKIEIEERWIHLLIKKQRHMFLVEVVNSVEEENGKRNVEHAGKSRKEGLHGYGLMNVQQIIERHNGEMNCLLMKGKYLVNISMYKGEREC